MQLQNQTSTCTSKGKYSYITIPTVLLFEKLLPFHNQNTENTEAEKNITNYPKRIIMDESGREKIKNMPVILNPDGSIFKHGSLYLLSKATCYNPASEATLKHHAKNLVDFLNTLHIAEIDYLQTPVRTYLRPTYFYKSELFEKTQTGELATSTANGRIGSMIGFYREMQQRHDFHPTQKLWNEKTYHITYQDERGFNRDKATISTDLKIKSAPETPSGQYIIDGGKLYPYSKEQQLTLIESLFSTKNSEMILAVLIALTSGARSQTTFTLRHENIVNPETHKGDEVKILIGHGTNVDNKFGKRMNIYIPAWLNRILYTYINSERHIKRCRKFDGHTAEAQYIFLTQHGNPYYISKMDERRGQNKPIQDGYSIRQFSSKTLQSEINKSDSRFDFRFHNLRATFCMNIIEEKLRILPEKPESHLIAIEYTKRRMGHSDIKTTERYFRFRKESELIATAQSDFEKHLEKIAGKHEY